MICWTSSLTRGSLHLNADNNQACDTLDFLPEPSVYFIISFSFLAIFVQRYSWFQREDTPGTSRDMHHETEKLFWPGWSTSRASMRLQGQAPRMEVKTGCLAWASVVLMLWWGDAVETGWMSKAGRSCGVLFAVKNSKDPLSQTRQKQRPYTWSCLLTSTVEQMGLRTLHPPPHPQIYSSLCQSLKLLNKKMRHFLLLTLNSTSNLYSLILRLKHAEISANSSLVYQFVVISKWTVSQ